MEENTTTQLCHICKIVKYDNPTCYPEIYWVLYDVDGKKLYETPYYDEIPLYCYENGLDYDESPIED